MGIYGVLHAHCAVLHGVKLKNNSSKGGLGEETK